LMRTAIGAVVYVVAIITRVEGSLVSLCLFLAAYFIIGGNVVWRAARNILHGKVFDENFLMSIATIGAFIVGDFAEAVAVMLFYQVGELFQDYAVDQSRKSIAELMNIRPDYANVQRGDALEKVDPDEVQVGETIVVKPGERVPLDAVVLSGAPLLADHIATQRGDVVLIGPDEEALQWVAVATQRHGWAHAVCRKTRQGDRQVDIELPALPVAGRAVVLIDDVASSGHTLARAAQLLRAAGASSVDVAVTHALFAPGAEQLVRDAGVDTIWSTDCIGHTSNAVSIVPAVAVALLGLLGQPVT